MKTTQTARTSGGTGGKKTEELVVDNKNKSQNNYFAQFLEKKKIEQNIIQVDQLIA